MNNKLREQYCLEKGGINPSNIIEWYYIEWLENKLIEQPSVVSDEEIKDKANEQPDNYEQALPIRDVSGSVLIDLNTQVEILKKVINKLMITFDNEDDRIDYILDIVNEYKKQVSEHYR